MPISKLVEKLWETVGAKSLSALCKPGQIRREGIASIEVKRKEMLIMAQTKKEIEDIESGKSIVSLNDFSNPKVISLEGGQECGNFESMEPHINFDNLTKVISTQIIANEIQKEINIANSLSIAEDLLSIDQSEPTDDNIEDDWLYRWRDCASNTTSEKLQNLWGRVLAGELKSPGSYSLRTLEFIKNLSQKEAGEIQKILSLEFNESLIKSESHSNNYNNEYLDELLNIGNLIKMQSLGILSGVESTGLKIEYSSNVKGTFIKDITYDSKVMRITHEDENKKLTFKLCLFTPLGLELRSLCAVEIDSEYLKFLTDLIKDKGFSVSIWDLYTDDNGIKRMRNEVMV